MQGLLRVKIPLHATPAAAIQISDEERNAVRGCLGENLGPVVIKAAPHVEKRA